MDHEEVNKDIEIYESTSIEAREYLASISEDSAEAGLKNICNPSFWKKESLQGLRQGLVIFGNNREGSSLKAARRLLKILKMTKLAPIALFVYNRFGTTKKTVEALKKIISPLKANYLFLVMVRRILAILKASKKSDIL